MVCTPPFDGLPTGRFQFARKINGFRAVIHNVTLFLTQVINPSANRQGNRILIGGESREDSFEDVGREGGAVAFTADGLV